MDIIRFGTGGWRARVGEGFDEAHVVRIADALAEVWARSRDNATILLGYDTRRDSRRYALRAAEAIAAAGLRAVVSDRPCPTPALCLAAARDERCQGAVMLTASGAPHDQGGVVAYRGDGGPVGEAFADAVELTVSRRPSTATAPIEHADFVTPYISAVLGYVAPMDWAGKAPRVVVDVMYGTGVGFAADVFGRLGVDVITLHDEAVPDFRGLHPDVREPWVDQCERAVVESAADLGIVFDGDMRHCGIIDGSGRLVSCHDIAPLVMAECARQGRIGRIVGTFATSLRVERQADLLGYDYTRVPVGFGALYREFHEGDVVMAANSQGGVCLPAHLYERDGLLSACLACMTLLKDGDAGQVLARQEEELGHLEWGVRMARVDPSSIQRLRNVLPGVNPAEVAGMAPEFISHGDGLRVDLPDESWLLVRPAQQARGVYVVAEAPGATALSNLMKAGTQLIREYTTVPI